MAKFNIPFDGVDYLVDESALAAATAVLQSHFSTVMSGSGETITLNGTSYNVDSTKLSVAKNDFVSHLGTIAGNGSKVKVNGVEYPVDTAKVSDATAELHAVLGGMISGGGEEEETIAAGLYETGSNYTVLLKSWEDLLAEGLVKVDNNAVSVGTILPDNMPEKNEYGFYYGVAYTMSTSGEDIVFKEDTSFDVYNFGEVIAELPAGAIAYSDGSIDMSAFGFGIGTVSADGTTIVFDTGLILTLGAPASLGGDLLLPADGTIKAIDSFANNTELTGVVIPDSVTSIGIGAFTWCQNLTSVTFGENSQLTNIGEDAFLECTNLASVTFGENSRLTTIDWQAFAGCANLTSIEIPDSVTSIGESAFGGCVNLTTIIFKGTMAQWNDIVKGEGWNYNAPISCIQCSDGTIQYTIPGLYETGTDNMIMSWDALMNNGILSYDGMINSGQEANLAGDLLLPDSMTTINEGAFKNCDNLTSVTIPDSVTTIGELAFSNCFNFTSITIPDSVTSISEAAFSGCANLTSVTVGENNAVYYSSGNCIIEKKTNTLIAGCNASVIPNDIIIIGNRAFKGCLHLTSITIPDSVTSIGEAAFASCDTLTSITIPDSVTSIGEEAFISCSRLISVTIGNGVTSIGDLAFASCSSLIGVTIGNGVTSIGDRVFQNCRKITSITFKGTVAQWNTITKGTSWNSSVPATTVQCSDGTVQL